MRPPCARLAGAAVKPNEPMKVLVVGGGGREHALVWKLAQSPQITQMWCAPGNAGIAGEQLLSNGQPVSCRPIGPEDLQALAAFAQDHQPDLTVVGPDNPLGLGIVDLFQKHGLPIWGPNKKAARFEASKIFSQQFMEKHGVPAPRSGIFSEPTAASRFAAELGGRCAVKADGLALGKGVLICHDMAQADEAIDAILRRGMFGEAGRRIVIQELLTGMEISLHALCDGRVSRLFPTSQDHKRAYDGDQGPNTGGMGTYSPAPFLSEEELAEVARRILGPWQRGCEAEGIEFHGILYPGIMLTSEGPKVLEFNTRFGDPETQVYLPRLENDLLDLLLASTEGRLAEHQLRWRPDACVCVVMASEGYPGSYPKCRPITGIDAAEQIPGVKVFHAGTQRVDGQLVTHGGRVLGVTAMGPTLEEARRQAYAAVAQIHFEGAHYRRDIAAKALAHIAG